MSECIRVLCAPSEHLEWCSTILKGTAAIRCISTGGDRRAMIDDDDGKRSATAGSDRGSQRPGSSSPPVAATVASPSSTQPTIRCVPNGRLRPCNATKTTCRVQICRDHSPPSSAAACGGDDILPSTAHLIPPSLRSSSIANLAPSIIKLRSFRANPMAPIPPPTTAEATLTSFLSALIQPLVSNQACWMAGDSGRHERVSGGLRASTGGFQVDRGGLAAGECGSQQASATGCGLAGWNGQRRVANVMGHLKLPASGRLCH
ncbi:hypothetical protein ACLOJK_041200 [Asimina triloba]